MSYENQNLSTCPRCESELTAADSICPNCRSDEVEDVDLLGIADQEACRLRLHFQRESWRAFDGALREYVRTNLANWEKITIWKKFWGELQSKAKAVSYDQKSTQERAARLFSEKDPPPPPPRPPTPPPVDAHIEAVRKWVSELEDGEISIVAWQRLLDSLSQPTNDLLLESIRDEEIRHQFAEFETARVNPSGKVQTEGKRSIRKVIERLGENCELILLRIPGGKFRQGSERYLEEGPVRVVSVRAFYLGQTPVTQSQWRAVAQMPAVEMELATEFSSFTGDNHPAECISWAEAIEFCARLTRQTGKQYRLPSEAEWEYACRASSKTEFAFGETISPVIVNYDGNCPYGQTPIGIFRGETVEVGSMGAANRFGLYDMHGNVCEWCADEWHHTYEGAPGDGTARLSGNGAGQKVVRGGSWTHSADTCRSSHRWQESADPNTKLHYMGFRVACDL